MNTAHSFPGADSALSRRTALKVDATASAASFSAADVKPEQTPDSLDRILWRKS